MHMIIPLRNNRFAQTALVFLLITVCLLGYTRAMAKWGSGEPPTSFPLAEQADLIVVHKAAHTLTLMRHDVPIPHFAIVMGRNINSRWM